MNGPKLLATATLALTATLTIDANAQTHPTGPHAQPQYEQPQYPPAPYAPPPMAPMPGGETITREKPVTGLLIAGPIVFGVSWLSTIGLTAGVSGATGSSRTGKNVGYSVIPVFGPLIFLADPDSQTSDYAGALVGSTLLQTGGIVMTILGAVLTTEETVRIAELPNEMSLSVTPGVAGADVGAEGATATLAF